MIKERKTSPWANNIVRKLADGAPASGALGVWGTGACSWACGPGHAALAEEGAGGSVWEHSPGLAQGGRSLPGRGVGAGGYRARRQEPGLVFKISLQPVVPRRGDLSPGTK